MKFGVLLRKIHLYLSAAIALPFLVILTTGFMLLSRHYVPGIQPASVATGHAELKLSFDEIFQIAKAVPEAGIREWQDVVKLDVRPRQGLIRVNSHNQLEIQIDGKTGKVLKAEKRYTGLLISLHEGIYFHRWVRDGLFYPTAIGALALWFTGVYLFVVVIRRKKKAVKQQVHQAASGGIEQRIASGLPPD